MYTNRQPVRRHSRPVGQEAMFWRPTDRQAVRKIVLAAKRYELVSRRPGRRNGAIGSVAIEILDLLGNLVSFRSGRLDPSIATMQRLLKRSRDAVVTALKALRQHGFLDWLRRYVPTGNTGKGPQVQQTSNAYALRMPKAALRLLPGHGQPPPVPDDHSAILEACKAAIDEHRATLPLDQRTLFDVEDPDLAQSLVRLARGIMTERGSGQRSEPSV